MGTTLMLSSYDVCRALRAPHGDGKALPEWARIALDAIKLASCFAVGFLATALIVWR